MDQIIDEKQVASQFYKEYLTKQKLQTLQQKVFVNYTIKRSVSVLHPKSQSPTLSIEKKKDLFIPSLNSQRQSNIFPAVTSISFGKNDDMNSFSKSARTLSHFTPRVKMQVKEVKIQKEEKLLQKMKKLQLNDLKKEKNIQYRTAQVKDSQSLMRKNSLFLISFLKTRYKQKKGIHIGERAEAANPMRLGSFSEKNMANTLYHQRFEYMQQARQRLLKAKAEKIDNTRVSRLSPLLPEPWENDNS